MAVTECPVCLEENLTAPVALVPCGHLFCMTCLLDAREEGQKVGSYGSTSSIYDLIPIFFLKTLLLLNMMRARIWTFSTGMP